ncbi:MAG: hypothetical protein ACLSVD_19610 [Eggerthellaceae bacterium]
MYKAFATRQDRCHRLRAVKSHEPPKMVFDGRTWSHVTSRPPRSWWLAGRIRCASTARGSEFALAHRGADAATEHEIVAGQPHGREA